MELSDCAIVIDESGCATSVSFPQKEGENDMQTNCIRRAVEGFYQACELGPCLYMWMNEEPPAGAKINELASNLFENLNKEKICIHGPVIITGRGNEDGNLVSLTKSEIDFFLNFAPTPLALL